ncbi:MAG: hypothetical protein Q8914_10240 [Bacteroidota bacterium]|nr:hypothetical protein [Bacteroidota bacterium]
MDRLRLLLCVLTLIAILYSCDKEDDNQVQFDQNKAEVIIGKTTNVTIKGSEATYTVVSSDAKIATAQLVSKEITVTGVKEGNVVLTVTSKSGKTGKIAVSVIKDPYEAVKADAKTRFVWSTISKIQGTDNGVYTFTQGTDGKVQFHWISEDTKHSIVLTFSDAAGSITEGIKKNATLTVDGKAMTVNALSVIQVKAVTPGDKPTVWIVFSSDKTGVCVGKLA